MDIYLNFSDAAKFADIARNLVNGFGYGNSFSFWSLSIFDLIKNTVFLSPWTPPLMPYSIAIFFKIFGVNDFAVIATSLFYFLLTLVFVFLLAKKIFKSNLVGILSTVTVGFNYDLIHYATNGASESPFIFEILAASYFVTLKKSWGTGIALILLVLMYFTRPQAFIYIMGIVLYWLLINFKPKKALLYFGLITIIGFFIDIYVLSPLSGHFFIYAILARGQYFASRYLPGTAVSDALRGQTASASVIDFLKKIFYNIYNFYKLIPQIVSPYIFALFMIGLFKWNKDKIQNYFKIVTLFIVVVVLIVAAASIPFFRYIHPVIPLVYILAVGTLVEIIGWVNSERLSVDGVKEKKFPTVHSSLFTVVVSSCLILVFGVGQTLGILLLDSRFEKNTHNVGKPPVYVELSKILKENTKPTDVVITNLDTWGSWYGERKTVWFPLEPKQLIDPVTGEIPFDAIYLTSYLIDDENYYMGKNWRLIFENPQDPSKWICDKCGEIGKGYKLKGVFKIYSDDNYDRQNSTAVLLVKK